MAVDNKRTEKVSNDLPGDMILEGGYSYLIEEVKGEVGARLFENKEKIGEKILYVTRKLPNKLETEKDMKNKSMIWLTYNKGPNCIEPTNITRLSLRIQKFLAENHGATIIFDGLEYLSTQNEFSTILHFLQLLNDKIMISDSKLILSLNPEAFKPNQLAQIEREMELLNNDVLMDLK
jgi:hypothetical protein